ncbi:hypothetical protein THAOC_15798 [Thalassiosira oceanica]|uniref:peptidylprolyl isomerase n=1 Tax=Thalassiosira oceanica TaxID=159749 RepID=K0SEW8_THAOC|nr:hypothetical protein THAOC_15798 [Thalassiosira oceanica]|eukprot:EJK63539.1 hypothetical protein THAOC_15798 [Thalassiosira oceanica]
MSKKRASGGPPKTMLDKIVYAIRSTPSRNPNGVSRAAIAKYLAAELGVDAKSTRAAAQVKSALKRGVSKGILVQTGQSFRVEGDAVPDVPEEEKLGIKDLREGDGPACGPGDTVVMRYEGRLDDGTVFDKASGFEFTLGAGEVIKGWDEGIPGMRAGGKRELYVPSRLGYGKRGSPPEIPGSANLRFTVALREIK